MKIRMMLPIAAAGVALLLTTGSAWAHHAMIAEFSLDKPITLQGTLTGMVWTNPHAWIYMDVTSADGQAEKWAIETGSPLRMVRRGLKKSDFHAGIEIIVGGYAAKDGSRKVAGMIVTFPDREASGRDASFALGR